MATKRAPPFFYDWGLWDEAGDKAAEAFKKEIGKDFEAELRKVFGEMRVKFYCVDADEDYLKKKPVDPLTIEVKIPLRGEDDFESESYTSSLRKEMAYYIKHTQTDRDDFVPGLTAIAKALREYADEIDAAIAQCPAHVKRREELK